MGCANSSKKSSTRDKQNNSSQSSSSQEQEYQDAPDFQLTKMNGEPFTLSDHEGKVVVLNFWATWCPPCRDEIPDFIELQKNFGKENVLFVGVSVDQDGWEKVRPYAKKMNINYPIMVDDGTVSQMYGPIRRIPTTFIINKKGKIEYIAPGRLPKDKLEPVLHKLIQR